MGEVCLVGLVGWIEWVGRIEGLIVVVMIVVVVAMMVELSLLSTADCAFVSTERRGLLLQGTSHLTAREARNCPA